MSVRSESPKPAHCSTRWFRVSYVVVRSSTHPYETVAVRAMEGDAVLQSPYLDRQLQATTPATPASYISAILFTVYNSALGIDYTY